MNSILSQLLQNALIVIALLPVVWCYSRWRRHRPAEQNLLWLLLMIKLALPPLWTFEWPRFAESEATAPSIMNNIEPSDNVPAMEGLNDETITALSTEPIAGSFQSEQRSAFVWHHEHFGPTVWRLLECVFLAGTVIFAVYTLCRVYRELALVTRSKPSPPELEQYVRNIVRQMRTRSMSVRVVDEITGPVVVWWKRPVLLWPSSLINHDERQRPDGALMHELAHVRRFDDIVVWLETLLAVVQWWNPVFWYVRRQLRETRELACDAIALQDSNLSRSEYVELLVELTTGQSFRVSSLPMVEMGAMTKASLKRRIAMIFEKKVTGHLSVASVLMACCLAGMLVIAVEQTQGQTGIPSGETPPPNSPPAVNRENAPPSVSPTPSLETLVEENRQSAPPSTGEHAVPRNESQPPPEIPDQIRKLLDEIIDKEIPESLTNSHPEAAQAQRRAFQQLIVKWLQSEIDKPSNSDLARRIAMLKGNPYSSKRQSAKQASPPANFDAMKYELELAEIAVQEKLIELEGLKSDFEAVAEAVESKAAPASDLDTAKRKVKLAELGLRRTRIELDRAKATMAAEMRGAEGEMRTH